MVVGLEPVERDCAADSGDLSHYPPRGLCPRFWY